MKKFILYCVNYNYLMKPEIYYVNNKDQEPGGANKISKDSFDNS